jgi:hypothetical protein
VPHCVVAVSRRRGVGNMVGGEVLLCSHHHHWAFAALWYRAAQKLDRMPKPMRLWVLLLVGAQVLFLEPAPPLKPVLPLSLTPGPLLLMMRGDVVAGMMAYFRVWAIGDTFHMGGNCSDEKEDEDEEDDDEGWCVVVVVVVVAAAWKCLQSQMVERHASFFRFPTTGLGQ